MRPEGLSANGVERRLGSSEARLSQAIHAVI